LHGQPSYTLQSAVDLFTADYPDARG
jgi:hypothetical protein